MKTITKPSSWFDLSQKEREKVYDYLYDVVDSYLCDVQILTIKQACMILHTMGVDNEKLYEFIASFKTANRNLNRCKCREEQEEMMSAEMRKVFGEDHQPDIFLEKLNVQRKTYKHE